MTSVGLSEVTMKRGLASPCVHSALDHAPPARPAVPRRPAEVLDAPGRLARLPRLLLGLDQLDRDLIDQADVSGEAEHEVDPVAFAPRHQGGQSRNQREAGMRVLGQQIRM